MKIILCYLKKMVIKTKFIDITILVYFVINNYYKFVLLFTLVLKLLLL